jgi:hypothetical protein
VRRAGSSIWGFHERANAGVVFVDERSIRPNDAGGLDRNLVELWDPRGYEDWTNIVHFLKPVH